MYIKKIRRICDVKGCKNMDSFFISRIAEGGGSIVVCADCIRKAAKAIENYKEPEKKASGEKSEPPKFIFSRTDAEMGIVTKSEVNSVPATHEPNGKMPEFVPGEASATETVTDAESSKTDNSDKAVVTEAPKKPAKKSKKKGGK